MLFSITEKPNTQTHQSRALWPLIVSEAEFHLVIDDVLEVHHRTRTLSGEPKLIVAIGDLSHRSGGLLPLTSRGGLDSLRGGQQLRIAFDEGRCETPQPRSVLRLWLGSGSSQPYTKQLAIRRSELSSLSGADQRSAEGGVVGNERSARHQIGAGGRVHQVMYGSAH